MSKTKKSLKHSIIFKLAVIFILTFVLMIPTVLVQEIIHEREYVQQKAINEVSEKWSNGQTLTGPFIAIPYDKFVKQIKDKKEEIVKVKEWMYFLPEQLDIQGDIRPEKRYRGIYEVVVYESDLKIKGTFNDLDTEALGVEKSNIHFDQATLNLGISDLKGIETQIKLNWNGRSIPFNSGTSSKDIVSTGINASIAVQADTTKYAFDLDIELKGSQHIYFVPVGKTTDVKLTSNWTTPSFMGTYLPDDRAVTETGFRANWNVLHLNRNYPQSWLNNQHRVQTSVFGTDLLLPVDNYKKSNRVAKYAILFLVLTFMVFFFVEVLNKVFIHPIQYLLVGIALVVFYTLLVSFSEHIQFNYAYIVSAVLTLGLITAYTATILKSTKIGLLIFGILLVLYTFIFTIIQLEDYALLIGSIGVFIILAIVMYFSRKIDWYSISIGNENEASEIE